MPAVVKRKLAETTVRKNSPVWSPSVYQRSACTAVRGIQPELGQRMYVFYSTEAFQEIGGEGGLDAFWIGPDGGVGTTWAKKSVPWLYDDFGFGDAKEETL